jgi:hypothetical protein
MMAAIRAAQKSNFSKETVEALKVYGFDEESIDGLKQQFDPEREKLILEAKPAVICDANGEPEYTMEFSAETVSLAEESGFNIDNVMSPEKGKYSNIGNSCVELAYYALKMHHPGVTREEAAQIYDDLRVDKAVLVEHLQYLYMKPIYARIADNSKNGKRKVTF